ncbi:hypothetical protein ACOMHN_015959 [Nucella lapillus]
MPASGLGFEGAGPLLPTEDVEVFFNHLDNRPTATTLTFSGYTPASHPHSHYLPQSSDTHGYLTLQNSSLGASAYHNGDGDSEGGGEGGGGLITLQPPGYSDTATSYLTPLPSLLLPSTGSRAAAAAAMGSEDVYCSPSSAAALHSASQHPHHHPHHHHHHPHHHSDQSDYSAWGLPHHHPSDAPTYTTLPPPPPSPPSRCPTSLPASPE